jgi:NitT/TauT family transport system permease protein
MATLQTVAPRAARRRRDVLLAASSGFVEILSIVALLVVWELAGRFLDLQWLPPITSILAALGEIVGRGEIGLNLLASLQALFVGFLASIVIGLPIGALMGRYERFDQALGVWIYALFVAPNIVFVPVFFALFGLSGLTIIAVVVMYAVFVLIINVRAGVRNVDLSLVEMATSFGATERNKLWLVMLPAALPLVLAGVRLAIIRSLKGMINGEMFIAVVGLGKLSRQYGSQFDMSSTFAIVFVILLVALLLNGAFQKFETRLTRWID